MGSKLVGLKTTLTWKDFPEKKESPPAPGTQVPGAKTEAKVAISHKNAPTVASGSGFTLKDDITLTVSLDKGVSWVKSWVATHKSAADQAALLKHEQGHYDIAALIARDFFIDIMDMKSWEYTTAADVDAEYQQLKTDMRTKMAEAQKLYEDETKNGTVAANQSAWNLFLQRARTEVRKSGGQSPADGATYKKPLLEILRDAGKKI